MESVFGVGFGACVFFSFKSVDAAVVFASVKSACRYEEIHVIVFSAIGGLFGRS